jgi:FAD/FMN-containing dehydrogenase
MGMLRKFWSRGSLSKELTWNRYVNFAHGDEELEEIYGENLPRLRELKRNWDPKNRFNQWFNIR